MCGLMDNELMDRQTNVYIYEWMNRWTDAYMDV